MLDPWIIEEIRRREEEDQAEKEERPPLEIPVMEMPRYPTERIGDGNQPKEDRGVVIVDFTI